MDAEDNVILCEPPRPQRLFFFLIHQKETATDFFMWNGLFIQSIFIDCVSYCVWETDYAITLIVTEKEKNIHLTFPCWVLSGRKKEQKENNLLSWQSRPKAVTTNTKWSKNNPKPLIRSSQPLMTCSSPDHGHYLDSELSAGCNCDKKSSGELRSGMWVVW